MAAGTEPKYIFLDRDGVIIQEKHLLHKKEDVELIPLAAEAINLLNSQNYKVIIITNQPAVARGLCSEADIQDIHNHLLQLLKEKKAIIERIYYCPHHPTAGENKEYTKECNCRKPKPGMILQAAKDYKIKSLKNCFLIGDKIGDIKAGNEASCKTILVETGYGGKEDWNDAIPTFHAKDLYSAVKEIVLK